MECIRCEKEKDVNENDWEIIINEQNGLELGGICPDCKSEIILGFIAEKISTQITGIYA